MKYEGIYRAGLRGLKDKYGSRDDAIKYGQYLQNQNSINQQQFANDQQSGFQNRYTQGMGDYDAGASFNRSLRPGNQQDILGSLSQLRGNRTYLQSLEPQRRQAVQGQIGMGQDMVKQGSLGNRLAAALAMYGASMGRARSAGESQAKDLGRQGFGKSAQAGARLGAQNNAALSGQQGVSNVFSPEQMAMAYQLQGQGYGAQQDAFGRADTTQRDAQLAQALQGISGYGDTRNMDLQTLMGILGANQGLNSDFSAAQNAFSQWKQTQKMDQKKAFGLGDALGIFSQGMSLFPNATK